MNANGESSQQARWQPTGLVTTLLSAGARQVVRCWLGSDRFLDEHHHPRMILALADDPDTFPELVHAANPNLVSAVVLNELLRKGIVEKLESGHVLLRRSAYAPVNENEPEGVTNEETAFTVTSLRRRYNDI